MKDNFRVHKTRHDAPATICRAKIVVAITAKPILTSEISNKVSKATRRTPMAFVKFVEAVFPFIESMSVPNYRCY